MAIGAGIGFIGGIVTGIAELFDDECRGIECPARVLLAPIVILIRTIVWTAAGAAAGLIVGTVAEVLR